METIATITTNPREKGNEVLHHLSDFYELELDTRHDDGQATFCIKKDTKTEGKQRLDLVMTSIEEQMQERDYENIDLEEYTK